MVNYKVVRNNGSQLVSAIVTGPLCRVAYAKDVISSPPVAARKLGRGLLAFSNLESAEWFVDFNVSSNHLEIWECEVTNPRKPQPICSVYELNYGVFIPVNCSWPVGTVEVDTIKLTKKVSVDPPREEFRF